MATFTITPGMIRGDQLTDEINNAVDLQLTVEDVVYYPPDKLVVAGVAPENEAAIQAVIDAHVPTDIYTVEDQHRQTKSNAGVAVGNIPGWTTWDEQQALDWIDTDVTDLDSAKQALSAMARMIVAMRNKLWPELQDLQD